MNLNRTEELEIKKDIKGIRKSLEDISDKIEPVKPTTKAVVKDGDPFFGKIRIWMHGAKNSMLLVFL